LSDGPDNTVYLLDGAIKAVARIGKRRDSKPMFELAALEFLHNNGVPVPQGISTPDGKPYATFSDSTAGVLFNYVDGQTVDVANSAVDSEIAVLAGGMLGRIHSIGKKFSTNEPPNRTIYSELERIIEKRENFTKRFRGGESFVGEIEEALRFAQSSVEELSGLIHNDYRPQNILVGTGYKLNAVIDWDWCCLGPLVADVALGVVEYSFPDVASRPEWEVFDLFLEGYNELAPQPQLKDRRLYKWIEFACLSSAATYFADLLDQDRDGNVEDSYMYAKSRYFRLLHESGREES
jgi:Ser/Thr protein kinase RdoA (MazF antagonist)